MVKRTIIAASAAIILAAGLMSCSGGDLYSAPKFKAEEEIRFELLSDELMFTPWGIKQRDTLLVVPGFSTESQNTLFVFDKNTGELVREGVRYGRGPGETVDGYYNVTLDGDTVRYHERSGMGNMSFSLREFVESGSSMSCTKESRMLPKWCMYYRELPEDRLLTIQSKGYQSKDTISVRSVSVEKPDGSTARYDGSPVKDPAESFVAYMQPHVTVSPSGTRLAVAAGCGAILETFDISDGIENTSVSYYIKPGIVVSNGTNSRSDDSVFGIGGMCSTDDRILCSYDGEIRYGDFRKLPREERPLIYRNIATFDWLGRPQILYRSEYRVMYLCADENDGSRIYAILSDNEGRYYIGVAGF